MQLSENIAYEDHGKGDVPIVFLHGIGGNTDSFRKQLDGLSKLQRVIAWNMPGYGASKLIEPMTFATLSEKLISFLTSLDIQSVHLVGQSIGGMIALETACVRPEFVKTLTMIGSTSAFGGRDESFKDSFVTARLTPLDKGKSLPELAGVFVPEIMGPIASNEAVQAAIASMAAVPEQTYRDVIRCLVTFDRREQLTGLKMPCCLIAGQMDTNAPSKTMVRMSEKIPNCVFHEIQGAGHLVNLEAGEKTNSILEDFFTRHTVS